MEAMAHLQMVYLLKMVIFHGYVSHNQMVSGLYRRKIPWFHGSWQFFFEDMADIAI